MTDEQLDDTWQTVLAVVDEAMIPTATGGSRAAAERAGHRALRRANMAKLAAIVELRPGELEQVLHAHFDELAEVQPDGQYRSKLSHLWVRGSSGDPPAFMTRADPRQMVEFALRTLRRPDFLGRGPHVTGRLAAVSKLARIWIDAGGDAALRDWDLPPAVRDAFVATSTGTPLAPVLPSTAEIAVLEPAEVNARISAYTGLDTALLLDRLRPDSLSAEGFLAHDQDLGAQIVADAQTLARLGVDHRQLAARIELCVALGRLRELRAHAPEVEDAVEAETLRTRGAQLEAQLRAAFGPPDLAEGTWSLPWSIETVQYRGFQADPFQTLCMLGERGSIEFAIEEPDGDDFIEGGDLSIDLIRRLCFFEGEYTPWRIEPERAAWLLGLVGDDPLAGRGPL